MPNFGHMTVKETPTFTPPWYAYPCEPLHFHCHFRRLSNAYDCVAANTEQNSLINNHAF